MKLNLMPVVATIVLMALVIPTNAFCQLTEGFESGIPPTWTFSGPAGLDGTAQAASGIAPTEGTSYGWISNGCLSAAGTTCPAVGAVASPGYVPLGLGAGTGLGSPTTEVTLTSPSFSLSSPGVISFDVNFVTTDGTNGFADFALAQLVPSDATPINLFVANTTCDVCAAVPPVVLNPGVATLSPSQAFFAGTIVNFGATTYGNVPKFGGGLGGPTGWIHVTYSAAAGNYQLQFLVSHVGDTSYPSALAIDNVQVQTTQTVTQPLQPGPTNFAFNTGASVTKQTIDYTNSGTNPTGATMQVTLRAISTLEFQNLVAGTFAQGSQCFPQDFGSGVFGCAATIALCTTASNTTPLGSNCPQGTTGTIGVAEKFFTNAFGDPTTVPKPGYLAATDNALSCTNDSSNTCRALHNIFSGIADDCCSTAGTTKTFNSLFVPAYCVGFTVTSVDEFNAVGFAAPVDNPGTGTAPLINLINSKQAVPLKLMVTQACNATAVSNLDLIGSTSVGTLKSVVLTAANAPLGTCKTGVIDPLVTTAASGSSGWQNLGGGSYQYNWKPSAPVGSCLQFSINLGDNVQHSAYFQVTK